MEKHTPHFSLVQVKSLIAAHKVRATVTASDCAATLGVMGLRGMCDVVLSLTHANFYKSMTSNANHRSWQDVYHGKTPDGVGLYIKLTVVEHVLILSFKEL